MPELPEVESVRRGLVRARLSAPLRSIWRSRRRLRIGKAWARENLAVLDGAAPGRLMRRGKYILWTFTPELGAPLALLLHLGMSGRCGLAHTQDPKVRHTHLVLTFADDRQVRFVDPRRFGGLRAGERSQLRREPPLCDLGPEPLGARFDGAALARAAGASKRALRDVLLDQRVVAGVGNIYALEALFEAGLHPLVRAYRLRDSAWERLAQAVQTVLKRGIRNGGTTLRDFRNVTGRVGRNQDELSVYGRAGEPCPRCGSELAGFALGGRTGVFCPLDQPRPRSRRIA